MKEIVILKDMLDKTILIDCLNENVIPFTKKIQKGQFLLPFFFVCNKISLDEL